MIPWWAAVLIGLGCLVAGELVGWHGHARMLARVVEQQERERWHDR